MVLEKFKLMPTFIITFLNNFNFLNCTSQLLKKLEFPSDSSTHQRQISVQTASNKLERPYLTAEMTILNTSTCRQRPSYVPTRQSHSLLLDKTRIQDN